LARPFSEGVAYVETDKQRGFINRHGRWVLVLKEQLRVASPLREGLALVTRKTSGSVLIPAVYDFIDLKGELLGDTWYRMAYSFSEGLALVVTEGDVAHYLRKDGSILHTPKRTVAQDSFSNGLALVRSRDTLLYGFIDKNGVLAIPLQYSRAKPFSEGLSAIMNQQEKWGFANVAGELMISHSYDDADRFSEGLAAVVLRGACGYIDKHGRVVVPIMFDKCTEFSEGMAAVASVGGFGYIGRRGAWVIKPQLRKAGLFEPSGLAKAMEVSADGRCIDGLINRRGRFVWTTECFPGVP
jgi:hypothetical protein